MGITSIPVTDRDKTRDIVERNTRIGQNETTEVLYSSWQPLGYTSRWSYALYQAVRVKATGEVFAAIIVASRETDGHGQSEVCFKVMHEDVGPCECANVPAKLLGMLTDTSNEYALGWRSRARDSRDRVAAAKAMVGRIIRFDEAFSYGIYGKHDTFRVCGANRFQAIRDGKFPLAVRPPRGWQHMTYRVVDGPVAATR